MGLICLSFSHHHVPLAVRERIHFNADAVATACSRFRCGEDSLTEIVEQVILSTCNRIEVYAHFPRPKVADFGAKEELVREELIRFVAQSRQIPVDELRGHARWVSGTSVVGHLARVACGLESLVLGEPQILGQVGDALQTGLIMNSAGPVLSRLFQAAIRAGRRARTETRIGNHSLNVSTVAVNTAARFLGDLSGKSVVLLGAGDMAEQSLIQLRQKGVGEVCVVNRTLARARALAENHGGTGHVFEQIHELLVRADIVVASTGAPHTLITPDMVRAAMRHRPDRKMMIVDIAVPRDVDPAVSGIENVDRIDVDELHVAIEESFSMRQQQIPSVESIIETEMDSWLEWYRGIGVEETVARLRRKAEGLRQSELSRLARLLPNGTEEQWKVIEGFANSLVNKLLHDPTSELRLRQGTRDAVDYAEAIRELFHLQEDPVREPDEAKV